jgi:hypothetical protein
MSAGGSTPRNGHRHVGKAASQMRENRHRAAAASTATGDANVLYFLTRQSRPAQH